MSVLRKEKKGNFTVIDNAIFKDKDLSMKSIGLLCLMLALPDNWNYSIAGLVSIVSDGESAVRSSLKELEEAGYFRREQVREDGKIVKTEYVISEYKNFEKPLVENPVVDNPVVENPPQVNTNISNTKSSNKKDIYIGLPENLKETLYEFEEMRKSIKKPMTDVARKRLIRELQKLAGEDVQKMIRILDQSILNSWAGVYPLKGNTKGTSFGSGNPFADMLKGGMFDE